MLVQSPWGTHVSVLKNQFLQLPHLAAIFPSRRIRIKCDSSWFRTFLKSSINVFLYILSNALLMSRRSRYTFPSVDHIYAAWEMGIAESNLKLILFIIQAANIFLGGVDIRFHPLIIHMLLGRWVSPSLISNWFFSLYRLLIFF